MQEYIYCKAIDLWSNKDYVLIDECKKKGITKFTIKYCNNKFKDITYKDFNISDEAEPVKKINEQLTLF